MADCEKVLAHRQSPLTHTLECCYLIGEMNESFANRYFGYYFYRTGWEAVG